MHILVRVTCLPVLSPLAIQSALGEMIKSCQIFRPGTSVECLKFITHCRHGDTHSIREDNRGCFLGGGVVRLISILQS